MKVKPSLITMGPCPFCERRIVEKGKPNDWYREFFVKFNDGSNAAFAVCSDCYDNLDSKDIDKLVRDQIYTWGNEIQKQMNWFITTACHLKMESYAKTKNVG